MKWAVFLIVTLIILLPQPLLSSYTQSLDDYSVKLVESTSYGLASNGYINVNVSEAKQMIESSPNLVILDVRTVEEYNEGHIEDAVLMPVSELENRLDELGSEKDTLVYCGSGVRSATASQILVDNGFVSVYNMLGGITAWRNEGYWIEIIHEGDLIIDGTQTFVIENCRYTQKGSVHIEDYGKLVIRNSYFQISQSGPWEYEFTVEDYGAFEVENATVASNYPLPFSFLRHSKARLSNVTCLLSNLYSILFTDYSKASIGRLTLQGNHGIGLAGQCDVSIERSTINQLGVEVEGTTTKIYDSRIGQFNLGFGLGLIANITDLKPGFHEYLDCQEHIKIQSGLSLFLNKTQVERWGLGTHYNNEMTISNSTIGRLIIGIDGLSVTLEDLKPQYYTHKRVGKITLDGTRIVEVGDAWTISINSPPGAQSNIVTIRNSTVLLHPCNNSTVCLIDSIASWGFDWFFGTLSFESTAWAGSGIFNSNFFMYGNITFQDEYVPMLWYLSNVTRNYNIAVKDKWVNPMENVELTLFNQNYTAVWNGTTDNLGKANFNLTFTDNNYTDTLRLVTFEEGYYNVTEDVGFLSDTPISVTSIEKPVGDLNEDRTVNILDISIVAMAFGTKEGDDYYNVLADLDENGEVNIIDVSIVALDYGKTY